MFSQIFSRILYQKKITDIRYMDKGGKKDTIKDTTEREKTARKNLGKNLYRYREKRQGEKQT